MKTVKIKLLSFTNLEHTNKLKHFRLYYYKNRNEQVIASTLLYYYL